ncbi:hypothetical protein EVAR_56908_1 [Eumeta japonica]|uniref:Uncharacterized protein n=1 Tax=Eumeta variegata TaxID=151549 RepID=A0A4C1YF49_EUMVA|nr:hypothetical protein EVAR_56908_1 [Eumeta japonica]
MRRGGARREGRGTRPGRIAYRNRSRSPESCPLPPLGAPKTSRRRRRRRKLRSPTVDAGRGVVTREIRYRRDRDPDVCLGPDREKKDRDSHQSKIDIETSTRSKREIRTEKEIEISSRIRAISGPKERDWDQHQSKREIRTEKEIRTSTRIRAISGPRERDWD